MTDTRWGLAGLLGRLAIVCLAAAFMAGCGNEKGKDEYVEGSVDELYNKAMDELLAERYKQAAKLFDEVDRQHPYSVWSTRAQIMSAYANYKNDKFDDAIIGLDRFIQLHPNDRDITYAYYLKGMAYYDQIKDVKRDQTSAREALKTFDEMNKRFPNSRYSRDVTRKIDLINDHLAGKEMDVGRFYLKRGQQLAAIGRFRTVVDRYQTTSQVPEALLRLAEAYTELGVVDEARKVTAVLGYNYPASEWYTDSYELVTGKAVDRPKEDRSFMTRALAWLF
ncbi:MAG TPA: outer membrane protein assembly factor BamD [Alphaproteobacteria bacterium]|jgi:outer membrane protein assembly factor BamD|nr:outer membrane protein assembly factor BamD [Alphaproteobacteria bacterium]